MYDWANMEGALGSLKRWVDLEEASLRDAMVAAVPYSFGRLLDVGCGTKPYEHLFRPHVVEYLGIEHEGATAESRAVADQTYDGDTLPFYDGAFDTVLSNQVAEHVPDPARFFAELVRVLAVGGRLIMTVPFSYRIHSAPSDFHRFTRFALEHYCERHGLKVELLLARGGFWRVIGQKLVSHFTLRGARLHSLGRHVGSFAYERRAHERPRYWTLPAVAPIVVGIATAARLLDRIDASDDDTLGYVLVGTKQPPFTPRE